MGQDPAALAERWSALDAAHGPRTLLGLGVSNAHAATNAGQDYGRPAASMGRFLDGLDAPARPYPPTGACSAALGPKMVDLATARTSGWHPFLVTPEYSAVHRARVGAKPLIAAHLAVVLDTDPERARAAARAGVGMFVGLPAYGSNLARLGFGPADLVPAGSDRLIHAGTPGATVTSSPSASRPTWMPAPTTSPCTSCARTPVARPCPAENGASSPHSRPAPSPTSCPQCPANTAMCLPRPRRWLGSDHVRQGCACRLARRRRAGVRERARVHLPTDRRRRSRS